MAEPYRDPLACAAELADRLGRDNACLRARLRARSWSRRDVMIVAALGALIGVSLFISVYVLLVPTP